MKANRVSVRSTMMIFSLPIVAIPRATSCASFMLVICHRILRPAAFKSSRYLS